MKSLMKKQMQKNKKLTRVKAAEILVSKIDEMKKMILDSNCIERKKLCAVNRYVENGKTVFEMHCHECGHIHLETTEYSSYWYHSTPRSCKNCGNTNIVTDKVFNDRLIYLFVNETDDGFEYARFTVKYKFPMLNDWYRRDPEMLIKLLDIGMFDDLNGWFAYNVDREMLFQRNAMDTNSLLRTLSTSITINKTKTPWCDLVAKISESEKKLGEEREAKKATSKAGTIEAMRQLYKAKPIEKSMFDAVSPTLLGYIYSQKAGKTTYSMFCTKCKQEFKVDDSENSTTCPHCNTTFNFRTTNSSQGVKIVVYENTKLPENDLLMRVFHLEKKYDATNGFMETCYEKMRIFAGKKLTVYDRGWFGSSTVEEYEKRKFEKITVRNLPAGMDSTWGYKDFNIVQESEEISNIIKNSCLVYSGLAESYGFDPRYKGVVDAPNISYLLSWYKNPAIELVLKANLTQLTKYFIRDGKYLCTGKKLTDVLNVNPAVLKMVIKGNLEYDDMRKLSSLYHVDNTITLEMYQNIAQERIQAFQLIDLKKRFDISFSQAMKYIQVVYDHQCIEKKEAVNIWVDYLNMAKMLKIDLKDKTRLYPGSLKKEHDVAMFAYRTFQAEVDKAMFTAQSEKNKFFEYSYKDLRVIVPTTPEEIVEEATRQKNCLRSYVERIKRGDTVVVFIRKKETPDVTYLTAEVNNGVLNQLKGYCNSNPRNKEINEFVEHWAKAKGISIGC